jgi:2-oxoglutarate dehydrogenase E2 component (dihydrolipoamide succinyltransferase)
MEVRSPADQEGTRAVIRRWCRAPGEIVAEDEPLLELETDKVLVEVPAPASGLLEAIFKQVDDSVTPGELLARIVPPDAASKPADARPVASPGAEGTDRSSTGARPADAPAPAAPAGRMAGALSPAVRRLLAEHRLDPRQIIGTGRAGRLTAQDVVRHLGAPGVVTPPVSQVAPAPATRPAPPPLTARVAEPRGGTRRPHTPMRRRIAEHMARSMATAPHVTTVFEADLSRIIAHRNRHLADYRARGANLTLTAYFVAASVSALIAVPEINATFHPDFLELHADCNVGIGTALGNDGLIVPVLHRAQSLGLFGIASGLGSLVAAAREGRLGPEDVRGGTFTISNHGVSGSLLAAPIVINQPQVAILGIGKAQRRVVVDEIDGEDVQRVRTLCYVTLTIDHRAVDAFQANAFLTHLVRTLESWPPEP